MTAANPHRMTVDELRDLQARTASRPTLQQMRDNPAEKQRRGQKYGNQQVVDGAMKFDSKAEHRRWIYLVTLQKAGQIKGLRRQVAYELIPAQVAPSGKKERPTTYMADMVYTDSKTGKTVVEDVKGAVTPEFRLKRKLMLWVHGIEIQEIRS